MESGGEFFLTQRRRLRPQHAAVALITVEDGRYLLQLRDAKPDIFYPGHWGTFGGGVDDGETDLAALARELDEELALVIDPAEAEYFTRMDFDLSFAGRGVVRRAYYRVRLPFATIEELRLGEGADMGLFTGEAALTLPRIVPYDAYAIWLHENRDLIEL